MRTRFKQGELPRWLDKLGLSQAQFAFKAGVSPATIYRACRGDSLRRSMYVRLFQTLADLSELGAYPR